METPILTVAIPMYRAAKIGWLSLESFAGQQRPGVPWEVVILEDEQDDERLGEDGIAPFRDRLAAAGCTRIVYEIMPGQPALSRKWKRAGELAAPSSEIFFLQGCDDYSDSQRLSRTHRIFSEHAPDWTTTRYGLFYDIATGVVALYDDATKAAYTAPVNGRARHSTGLDMATRTEFVRRLPDEEVRRGVDHWFCCSVADQLGRPLQIVWDESEPDWSISLYTNGLNTISTLRWKQTFQPTAPFQPTDLRAEDMLSADCLARLQLLASGASARIVGQLLTMLDEKDFKLRHFEGRIEARDLKIQGLKDKITAREAKLKLMEEKLQGRNLKIAGLEEKVVGLKAKFADRSKKNSKTKRSWLGWLPN